MSLALSAANVKIFVSAKPKEAFGGEELKISLNIETLKRVQIKYPELGKIASLPIVAIKDSKKNVISDRNGTKISVVRVSRTYTIIPLKDITVEPLEVEVDGKKYNTKALNIKVLGTSSSKENFIFRMSSSKKNVVVGEPFIVKVELIEPIALNGANLEYLAPRFEDFTASTLGEGNTEQRGSSLVRTIRYLLTPKRAGKFTIDPATAKIEMQAAPATQTPFAFFGTESQWKNIVSNTVVIDVAKLPQKVSLIGQFRVHESIDKITTSAKRPITYKVSISGIGSLENIKDLKFSIPNVTVYNKEPKIEHIADDKGIQSRYSRTFVFISDHDFTIPSLSLKGYNSEKKALYTLKTKSYNIHIRESKTIASLLHGGSTDKKSISKVTDVKSNNTPSQMQKRATKTHQGKIAKESPTEKIEDILIDKEYYKRKYAKGGYKLSTLLLITLLALVSGFLIAWYFPLLIARLKGKKTHTATTLYKDYSDALSTLYPHTKEDPKIEEMVKNLYEVVNGNNSIQIERNKLEKMIKSVVKRKNKV